MISIIIPVYNVAEYIEPCLKSVINQTYQGDMECLIIDDGSTDNSISITNKIVADYDGSIKFEVLSHDSNRGLSAARNTGLRNAKGEYVYFLDSDDELSKDCLLMLANQVKAWPEAELVQGNEAMEAHFDNIVMKNAVTNDEARYYYYHHNQMPVTAWNKLLKREFLIKNNIWFKEGLIHEDLLWSFYLMKHLEKVSYLKDITYYYRVRPKSIITGTAKKIKADHIRRVYDEIFTNLTPMYESDEFDYYAKAFLLLYVRNAYSIPSYKRSLFVVKKISKIYGSPKIRFRLHIAGLFGKFNGGWLFMSVVDRVITPTAILCDCKRIMAYLKERTKK